MKRALIVFLPFLFLIICLGEWHYQAIKKYYPNLSRWENFMIGRHIKIEPDGRD
jgi:hypothetical protein